MNIQSKQLKEPIYNFFKRGFLGDVYWFFYSKFKCLSRMFAYARFGYHNYDYEASFIYPLISFKLKRVKECLINGYANQEEVDLNALDEAVIICDRLSGEDYEDKYMIDHDSRWGEIEFTFNPFKSSRKNSVTEEDKAQEWKERLEIMDKAEDDRKKDIDRLAEIMKTNLPCLWD